MRALEIACNSCKLAKVVASKSAFTSTFVLQFIIIVLSHSVLKQHSGCGKSPLIPRIY